MKSFYYFGYVITVNNDVRYVSYDGHNIICHKDLPRYNENIDTYESEASYVLNLNAGHLNRLIKSCKDSLLAVVNNHFEMSVIIFFARTMNEEDLINYALFSPSENFFSYIEKHTAMSSRNIEFLRSLTKKINFEGVTYTVKKIYNYIARNMDGSIYVFEDKPFLCVDDNEWTSSSGRCLRINTCDSLWEKSLTSI